MKRDSVSDETALRTAITRATNYEVTIVATMQKSERRAWWVALGAVGVTLVLATALFVLVPLKEKVPYLIMADAGSGRSALTRLSGDFATQSFSTSEAIARANIAAFIRARESYELSAVGERDWSTVFAMASEEVNAGYRALHAASNPKAPHKVHGRARSLRVRILSLQLPDGAGEGARLATVRFQRSLQNNSTGEVTVLDNKIATLEYTFRNNLDMSEEARLINPLGFVVTAYRVDSDYAAGAADAARQGAAS